MKESVGNALLYNIVITFVIVFIGLFVTSITYSKGYKVKNRMIEVIEKTYPTCVSQNKTVNECNSIISSKIDDELSKIGYRGAPRGWSARTCYEQLTKNINTNLVKYVNVRSSHYQVCFATINASSGSDLTSNNSNIYYVVNAYMYLDLPIIGENIMMPVRGETKTFLPGLTS